jgi:hypothetical protein
VDVGQQKFLAEHTFQNVFDQTSAGFWGGGVQVLVWDGRIYAEAGASRLLEHGGQLVGQRVFVSGGQIYKLGIPLRSRIEPWEIVAGYRFNALRSIVPYVGYGFGSYHYTEESDFAEPSENLDATHRSSVFQAGAEYRVHRWIGVAGELERTRVSGILGAGGISQQFATELSLGAIPRNESDLGGWSARLKVVIGR